LQWPKRSERLSGKYTLGTIDALALLIYSLGQPQREGQEGRRWLEPPCLSPALASLLQRWSSAIAILFRTSRGCAIRDCQAAGICP